MTSIYYWLPQPISSPFVEEVAFGASTLTVPAHGQTIRIAAADFLGGVLLLALGNGAALCMPDYGATSAATVALVVDLEPTTKKCILKVLADRLQTSGAYANVLIVHRGIDPASLPISQAWAPGNGPAQGSMGDFVAGRISRTVAAGYVMGTVLPDVQGMARLTTEIVLVPGGSFPAKASWDADLQRLKDLLTDSATQRMDPNAFITALWIESSATGPSAPRVAIANGPPFLSPSPHAWLEVRDEWNAPFSGALAINGQAVTIPAAAKGLYAIPAGSASLALAAAPCTMARLPSGNIAPTLTVTVQWPGHHAVQIQADSSGGCEPAAPGQRPPAFAGWLALQESRGNASYPFTVCTPGNSVRAIRDASSSAATSADALETGYYPQLVAAMRQVTQPDHFILIAGWSFLPYLDMATGADPTDTHASMQGPTILAHILGIASTTSRVLILVNSREDGGGGARKYFNDQFARSWSTANLPGATSSLAVTDGRYAQTASHHQKFVIVHNGAANGPLAFVGGIDLAPMRFDDPNHAIGGISGKRNTWHDIMACVSGQAVREIFNVFSERWRNAFAPNAPAQAIPTFPSPLPGSGAANPGSCQVQVARTYASRMAFSAPSLTSARQQIALNQGEPTNQPELPADMIGRTGPLRALRTAIQGAQRYIYFEDQYAFPHREVPASAVGGTAGASTATSYLPLGILEDLVAFLKGTPGFLMFMIQDVDLEDPKIIDGVEYTPISDQYRYRRWRFFNTLRAIDPTRVHIFTTPHVYAAPHIPGNNRVIHSKVWIVDDIVARIGSANLNRRSMTCDSEIDLIALDSALDQGARSLAKRLRVSLWGEHLGRTVGLSGKLDDPEAGRQCWLDMARDGTRVIPYDISEGAALPADNKPISVDLQWDGTDPDLRP